MKNREAQALFKESERLYRERRYDEALEALRQLDQRYPNTRNVLYPIAKCLRRLARFEEAAAICDRLILEFEDDRARHMRKNLDKAMERASAKTIAVASNVPTNLDDDLEAGFDALDLGDLPPLDEEAETMHIPGGFGANAPPPPRIQQQGTDIPWLYIGIGAVVAIVVLFGVVGAMSGAGSGVGPEGAAQSTEEFDSTQFYINIGMYWLVTAMITYCASLYLTLMISNKLPYGTFSDDALSIAGFSLLCLLLGTFLPCIGLIACIIILQKRYEMGFIEFLILIGINFAISIPFSALYFALFANQFEEFAATLETTSY